MSCCVRVETHVHDLGRRPVRNHHQIPDRAVELVPRLGLLQVLDHLHGHFQAHVPHLVRDRVHDRGVDSVPQLGWKPGVVPARHPGHVSGQLHVLITKGV